jgi:leader peptidase (prepilin peptidase)/N-methyltransferase
MAPPCKVGSSKIVFLLVVFIFGTVVGSFLNVCIVRLAKGESLVTPPSHCPNCRKPIPFYDNVPLLSYLWLRGRCRSCKQRISPRYFWIELATGLLAVGLAHRFGIGVAFVAGFIFAAALVVIAFIDLHIRIVPDVISLPGIALGLVFSIVNHLMAGATGFPPPPLSSFTGILIGGGILWLVAWTYERITHTEGMGGGDIKLLAMIGAFLGWPSVPLVLFIASLTGSVVGVFLMLKKGASGKLALPFAPFLCGGALVYLFYGEEILSLYLG